MKNKYITPDIINVKALENYQIEITFDTREKKIYDMKDIISKNKLYKNLKDKKYFKNIKIRGETIEWERGEDIAPEILYYNSKLIKNKNHI